MNKAELINYIAEKAEASKKQAEEMVNSFIGAVTTSLKKGEDVALTGFGTFSAKKRGARTARNPRTGAEIKVPAMMVPKFKAGKGLKDALK